MSASILVDKKGPIATVTFNRPERMNAANREIVLGLPEIMAELAEDKALRVVILRGAGGRAFMAGADLEEYETWTEAEARVHYEEVSRFMDSVENCPLPTIALIEGYAVGGGLELALACDFRVASDRSRVGIPIGRLGHSLDFENTRRALRLVAPSKLKILLFTDQLLSAEEARDVGLLDWVVPASVTEAFAYDLARTISTKAPLGLRTSKETIRRVLDDPQLEKVEHTAELVAPLFSTKDFREGVRAFHEKRTPQFTGE